MNELFNALLDISKLDAGAIDAPASPSSPSAGCLSRIEATFTQAAREKGLSLRMVRAAPGCAATPSCWSRSCSIWSPTPCAIPRRGGDRRRLPARRRSLRIEVCDSGIGIAEDQQRSIFGEFYQVAGSERAARSGWGSDWPSSSACAPCWTIRSASSSTLGKGSRFSVSVPRVAATAATCPGPPWAA